MLFAELLGPRLLLFAELLGLRLLLFCSWLVCCACGSAVLAVHLQQDTAGQSARKERERCVQ